MKTKENKAKVHKWDHPSPNVCTSNNCGKEKAAYRNRGRVLEAQI